MATKAADGKIPKRQTALETGMSRIRDIAVYERFLKGT